MTEGFRGWQIKRSHDRVSLRSASRDFIWNESTITAKCDHGCDVGFCLENHQCNCGIYSRKDLKHLLSEYSHLAIFGVVYNHGVVLEGETGYIAEKATIRALFTSDMALGKELAHWYPGVSIMLPPPEILAVANKLRESEKQNNRWEQSHQKKLQKEAEKAARLALCKAKYPGGPEAEKLRLLSLLRGASRTKIQEFCKAYGASGEWSERNWIENPGGSTKAKPGDMVFETNDDSRPLVYIQSCRNLADSASIRWCMDRNGILVRRTMFERWDASPSLLEARKAAIADWK